MSAKSSFVYFLRPIGASGPIKIGHSQDPLTRLAAFMLWSPVPLELVAQAPGARAAEKWVHDKFSSCRLHSEWFAPIPGLIQLIEQVVASGKIPGMDEMIGLSVKNQSWSVSPLAKLPSILRHHSIADADFAKAVGYSKATISGWSRYSCTGRNVGAAIVGLKSFGVFCSPEDLSGTISVRTSRRSRTASAA